MGGIHEILIEGLYSQQFPDYRARFTLHGSLDTEVTIHGLRFADHELKDGQIIPVNNFLIFLGAELLVYFRGFVSLDVCECLG